MDSRAIVRIALPLGVPVTAQTLGIILGPRHGALAVLLFLFVVLLGAPLLAGGRGGLGVLFAPTMGFMLGFVPRAWVAGLVMARLKRLPVFAAALAVAIASGIVVVYACGVAGLMAVARLSPWQALVAAAVFAPGDLLKALLTAFVAQAAYRSYPSAIAKRS